ncbi:hypothetical protein Ddye_000436 [Dipteronia dyeriana]|uniref:Uncharacterized protein n=1 Tax=Dipteronia dyeriana TaxID=168575 RepID=A0AAD9XMC4_9ROSI|nr:hypothetical protein Ddye_000436 [Dipteronia dyeriana]
MSRNGSDFSDVAAPNARSARVVHRIEWGCARLDCFGNMETLGSPGIPCLFSALLRGDTVISHHKIKVSDIHLSRSLKSTVIIPLATSFA